MPDPDFGRLLRVLRREGEPDRVPFIECGIDREIMEAVLGEAMPGAPLADRRARHKTLDRLIRFWHVAGYDYITIGQVMDLPLARLETADTAHLSRGQRSWQNESQGLIKNWEDFERYPWPRLEDIDYSDVEYVGRNLPDGMRVIFQSEPGGQLEIPMWLMGYGPFAIALKEEPELVRAVVDRVGEILSSVFATAAEIPGVGALWLGDDLGFKTGPMISPADLRRYIFPWHKRFAGIAHAHGMPFLLHACGNLYEVMDDLIDDVGIDAKHSFEDVIQPVAEAKRQYGQRIALLGGVDMDVLCRSSEDEVRAYTRRLIEECAPGGGWALGSGNTVANYVPVQNYLAMLDEGRRAGSYSGRGSH